MRIRAEVETAEVVMSESQLARKYRKEYNQFVSTLKGLTPS